MIGSCYMNSKQKSHLLKAAVRLLISLQYYMPSTSNSSVAYTCFRTTEWISHSASAFGPSSEWQATLFLRLSVILCTQCITGLLVSAASNGMKSVSGLTLTVEEWRVLACVLAENLERGDIDTSCIRCFAGWPYICA